MLAGDTVISGDPEPDKNPTATVVRDGTQGTEERLRKVEALALHIPECCLPPTPQASETSRWSGPSPEDPAPLTGRGSGARSMGAEMSPPSPTACPMHQGRGSAPNRREPLSSGSPSLSGESV